MPLNDDSEIVRKYLLGQLSDGEKQDFEQRLLTENELNEELDVTTEELVDEYLVRQLPKTESQWFEDHYLSSPQGKHSLKFARTFQRHFSSQEKKKKSLTEQLVAFVNRQTVPLRAAAGLAVVVIILGIFWFARPPARRSFATVNLTNSPSSRSGGGEVVRIKLKNEEALRVNLALPAPATSGVRYQAELIDGKGQMRTVETIGQDVKSVQVEIPAAWLTPGQYAVTLSTIMADNAPQRIPGNYQFIID
jgi:hypothetical protein